LKREICAKIKFRRLTLRALKGKTMNIHPSATKYLAEFVQWRRKIHSEPELEFDVHDTAKFIADKLTSFGCDEVVTGVGRTGVIGIIQGRKPDNGATIGLRADMDALPIHEETGVQWASKTPGKMHACGHDGHMAMLLGAAKILTETRDFTGRVVLIFQPAEEGAGGAREMIEDGLFDRFPIDTVFGMHNMPGTPAGHFAIKPGPIMASVSRLSVKVIGKGGHGAMPHTVIDPIVASCAMITEMQSIARNVDPLEPLVISIGAIKGGSGLAVIPEFCEFGGTVRTLSATTTDLAEKRLQEVIGGVAAAHRVQVEIEFKRNYPTTINHPQETALAVIAAQDVAGSAHVAAEIAPIMASEDFAFMLNERPGAMMFIGNGDSANLHNAAYDFDDEILAPGVSYWVKLAQTVLANDAPH
jgi:hippurate hydrolase